MQVDTSGGRPPSRRAGFSVLSFRLKSPFSWSSSWTESSFQADADGTGDRVSVSSRRRLPPAPLRPDDPPASADPTVESLVDRVGGACSPGHHVIWPLTAVAPTTPSKVGGRRDRHLLLAVSEHRRPCDPPSTRPRARHGPQAPVWPRNNRLGLGRSSRAQIPRSGDVHSFQLALHRGPCDSRRRCSAPGRRYLGSSFTFADAWRSTCYAVRRACSTVSCLRRRGPLWFERAGPRSVA